MDLDFLFLEYDRGKAVAIVEYKHERAAPQYATHPTYMAMIDLGTRAAVPVFACRYSADFARWEVTGLNRLAKALLDCMTVMTEREWVTFLYKLRGYDVPDGLFDLQGVPL